MKITAIPQFARNLNRAQEVVRILSKYGLADWLSQLNIGFGHGLFRGAEGDRLADLTREARVRLALTELGTTFIKLGQVLSTRRSRGIASGGRTREAASRRAGR